MAKGTEPIRQHPLAAAAGRQGRQPGRNCFVHRLTSEPNLGTGDGDVEARHKVLWFFEAALAAAITTIIAGAIDLTMGDSMTPNVRAVIQLVFNILNGLIMVICFAAAVFYAGAISPALIVRKTLVYGATVALLLFLAAVVEIYVAHSLIHALHVNDSFVSAVLGAIFGLAFHPLKHRIEHSLKRFAPKDKAVLEPAGVAKPVVEFG